MSLDITWHLTVSIPQLDTWGERIVAELQGIKDAIVHLAEQQAQGSEAIAAQLTAIADEISQLQAGAIDQGELDALEAQIRDAAATATQQAADIRANTQSITQIVPDAPTPPTV